MPSVSIDIFKLDRLPDFWTDVSKRTVKEVVGDKIAALIASGMLGIGDVLPGERELASALQVSRETVRGAVQMLAARGILEVSHGARTRVVRAEVEGFEVASGVSRNINSYDIDAVHAARMLVERQVVADAARLIDAAALAVLDDSLRAQRLALDEPVQFLICDREFHVAIYQACGNPLLADFVTGLYTYMMDHRRKAMSGPGAIERSYADHVAIVAALRVRDPEEAVAGITVHLDRIYTTTRLLIGAGAEGAGGEPRPASTGAGGQQAATSGAGEAARREPKKETR